MRQTKSALHWIVDILRAENAPFQIDGGLAAELYGAKRELADIDINVSERDFDRIVPHVREYIRFGPTWYQDEHWKLYMMTLKFDGQNIDLSPVEKMQYFDPDTNAWVPFPSDLSDSRIMRYLDMDLPVIREDLLIAYKEKINRGVDRKDVKMMEENLTS